MIAYLKTWLILHRDCRGVTALEYALLAALIGLALSAAGLRLGTNMSSVFTKLGSDIGT